MERLSYADTLKSRLVYAPTASDYTNEDRRNTSTTSEDEVEPNLITVVTSLVKHAAIPPTKAMVGEKLPDGYSRSGFLLCNNALEVKVNHDVVRRDMERL